MKTFKGLVASFVLAMTASAGHAATYTIDFTIGSATVFGMVQTDGSSGDLDAGSILGWEVTAFGPSDTATISSKAGGLLQGGFSVAGNQISTNGVRFGFWENNTVNGNTVQTANVFHIAGSDLAIAGVRQGDARLRIGTRTFTNGVPGPWSGLLTTDVLGDSLVLGQVQPQLALTRIQNPDTAPIPLPAGAVLLITALGGLALARRRA